MITGTLGANGATGSLGDGSRTNTAFMGVQLTGTFTATVTFQGTIDGTNWVSISARPYSGLYDSTLAVNTATAVGAFLIDVTGLRGVRLNVTAYTSGTITYTANPVVG